MAFTGEAIETIALAEVPPGPDDVLQLSSFRGGCGELVIVAGDSAPWLAVFAP